jgi:hypothetical protein
MITASPQAMLVRNPPLGAESVTRTVSGSTTVTSAIPAKSAFCALVESSARARSSENFTSSAVNSVPSWKVTPSRSRKV